MTENTEKKVVLFNKNFRHISDDPRIEVLRVSAITNQVEPYSFRASMIDHLEGAGADKSVIALQSGTTVMLSLPYAELADKIDEGSSPIDLKAYCAIVAPAVEPKAGDRMEDGTFYLGRFKSKDGTTKDWFAAANDAQDGSGRRLSLSFNGAAEYAGNSKAHGHDDWMVPPGYNDRNGQPDVLNAIFNNKAKIGGFDVSGSYPNGWYWSSSPGILDGSARCQRLSDGYQYYDNRRDGLSVRPVRSLTI